MKMIEVRFAKEGETARQKEIWKLSFGDSNRYIDFYYAHRYREDETLLLLEGEEIAAMLTMLPVRVTTPAGASLNSAMLYALATHPEYRHRGYATRLLELTSQHLGKQGNFFSVIVPAGKKLFAYYRNRGFQDFFFVRQVSFDRKKVESLPVGGNNCTITAISPQEYNLIREKQLSGRTHVSYSIEDIDYQRKLSQLSGADIYGLAVEGEQGCAVIEMRCKDRLLIKELLIADQFIPTAVRHIAQLLPAEKYILRTPPFLGSQLEGSIRPFGMIRANQGIDPELIPDGPGYLGLAFD